MPEENPLTRTLREIVEKREQETRIHREHLNCLKDSFRKNQGDLTDAELLEIILDASSRIDKLEFDQEDDLDPYMSSLTFTTTSLVEADGESLKSAWSKFLGKTFLDMKDRDGDRYDIIALWYFTKEMWPHSVQFTSTFIIKSDQANWLMTKNGMHGGYCNSGNHALSEASNRGLVSFSVVSRSITMMAK